MPPRDRKELERAVKAQRLHEALRDEPEPPVLRAPSRPSATTTTTEPHIAGRVGPPPVPHINQARPDGATSEYLDLGFCGPTCMAMIARVYGLGAQLSDAELVQRLARIANATTSKGTDRFGLYRMAAHLGLHSLDWNGEATFWMARQLELGHYIIAAGNPFVLPPFEKLAGYGAHFIVVDGMDGDGNFLMKNPWPDGVHVVAPQQMWQFLMTHRRPYQYAFWR